MKKLFTFFILFLVAANLNISAQQFTESDDFETGPGTKFGFALTDQGATKSITAPDGVLLCQARYEASAIVQRWINSDCGFGFDIKNNPFFKFDAKASKVASMTVSFMFCWTDGSSSGVNTSISLTTTMQTFNIDMATIIQNAETSNNKTLKLMRYIQLQFPYKAPGSRDTFALYLDNWKLGDAANPCVTPKPTLTAPSLPVVLNFNASTPVNANLSGIASGDGGAVTITAVSSDPTIVANPTVIYNSPDATGTLQILGAKPAKAGGPVTITVTAKNGAACNNTVVKTFSATVKAENLHFTFTPTTVNTTANAGEQTVYISNITNIKPSGTSVTLPDNYEGLSMSANVTTGSALLSNFTDVLTIDENSGTAQFKFTPQAEGKVTVNLSLNSTTGIAPKTGNLVINIAKAGTISLDNTTDQLEVYPNPASDVLNVVLSAGAEKVDIIDMAGVIAKSINVKGQSGTIAIAVGDLAKGSYVISAGSAKTNVVLK